MDERIPWPHQDYAFSEIVRKCRAALAIQKPARLCLTTPTGGGKTDVMMRLSRWASGELGPVVIYTPRKSLISQLIGNFKEAGIPFGVRSADFPQELRMEEKIQISSPQTEDARCFRKVRWQLHPAKFVLVDEIHLLRNSDVMQAILKYHYDNGACIVLVTATPIGVHKLADELIVAGTNTELRRCGALVPAYVYGCEEFDTSKIERLRTGTEFTAGQMKKIWTTAIFGRVITHMKRLNPEKKPGLLFAPGVEESVWFAKKFQEAGHRWAHIDGDDIWLDGESYASDPEARKHVIELSRTGEIEGICNRYVMREGLDLPWLEHLILACVICSMQSFLQTVGRVLRAHPGIDSVTVQDHGGHWWRHGSPNQDRDWLEYWGSPEKYASLVRAERIANGKEPEPITCPKCFATRLSGDKCWACGYRHTTRSRMVIQQDGELVEMKGDIFKPRRTKLRDDTQQKWTDCYWRMRNAKGIGHTFRQAEGLFFRENFYWPPRTLEWMPKSEHEYAWFSEIKDVPFEELIGEGHKPPKEPEGPLFPREEEAMTEAAWDKASELDMADYF